MKKIIALTLTFIMLFSFAMPLTLAVAVDESKLPVIYIVGKKNTPVYKLDENGDYLRDENGKMIEIADARTPGGMSREEYIKSQIAPVLKELGPALLLGDYTDYIQSLVDSVAPIYEEEILNADGVDTDSAICWDYSVQEPKKGAGGLNYYYFRYDWRYAPYETADELHQFVEYVCEKEGVKKVNIHARCYGSNVAVAYIGKSAKGMYDAPFRVNNICLNTTPLAGYIAVGALMSGSVKFDADSIDRFVTYYLNNNDVFDDPLIEDMAMVLVSVVNQAKLLGFGADVMDAFYAQIAQQLIPSVALVSYGTFPSYWSMIGDQYYDKAKLTVFGTTEPEGEYANFITKIDKYHELIGERDDTTGVAKYEELLKQCEKRFGMKTAVFAKYGYATVPLFENSDLTGDTRGTVTELSLGGIGTIVGETFTQQQLDGFAAMEDYDARYVSPDNKIYAGTCLFPETTWFSRNLDHDQLTQIDPIATAFFLSDGALTVHTDERYPQFFEYEGGKFNAVDEKDENDDLWTNDPISVLIRFFTKIFDFFKAFFKGEISIGK